MRLPSVSTLSRTLSSLAPATIATARVEPVRKAASARRDARDDAAAPVLDLPDEAPNEPKPLGSYVNLVV